MAAVAAVGLPSDHLAIYAAWNWLSCALSVTIVGSPSRALRSILPIGVGDSLIVRYPFHVITSAGAEVADPPAGVEATHHRSKCTTSSSGIRLARRKVVPV